MNLTKTLVCLLMLAPMALKADHIYVWENGSDDNDGTRQSPLRTISAAAERAQPGDTVIVGQGTYREWVKPARGGTSPDKRITYQAAEGATVHIKGSEVVENWQSEGNGVWRAEVPNSVFGDFNPFARKIGGGWFIRHGRWHHLGAVYIDDRALFEAPNLQAVKSPKKFPKAKYPEDSLYTWFAKVGQDNTTVWANFQGEDPNQSLVEINVRPACFYPESPGNNYITVRGFHMSHAATQWASPITEQVGLIGTHWSKGWIIEDNVIKHSRNSGITLGKDMASNEGIWKQGRVIGGTTGYIEVIFNVLEAGWSKDTIGSHIVRRNTISQCEQTGICGSMGAAYSEVTDNDIHDIWIQRQFSGQELAAVKFHGAIDTLIARNRLSGAHYGLWLDWMTQGTRVTQNLFFDNSVADLYSEVNHGPYVVDNNIFLSPLAILNLSQGGTFVHNLIAGAIAQESATRVTPYLRPHSTSIAGFSAIHGGDDRYYNNIFVQPAGGRPAGELYKGKARYGLAAYDADSKLPNFFGGNVYLNGAMPSKAENAALELKSIDPAFSIEERDGEIWLTSQPVSELADARTQKVTTALLGEGMMAQQAFLDYNGDALAIETDYFGQPRAGTTPLPGPFNTESSKANSLPVWKSKP